MQTLVLMVQGRVVAVPSLEVCDLSSLLALLFPLSSSSFFYVKK